MLYKIYCLYLYNILLKNIYLYYLYIKILNIEFQKPKNLLQ